MHCVRVSFDDGGPCGLHRDMFIVISRTDSVRLSPADLGRDVQELLAEDIDAKYANRVIPDIGLAISLFAIDKVVDPFVLPGDGGAYVRGESAAHDPNISRSCEFRGRYIASESLLLNLCQRNRPASKMCRFALCLWVFLCS